mgnify:CR=1 FL=1
MGTRSPRPGLLYAPFSLFARERLGSGVAPREIDFLPSMPKTRSGKIMRRLLKEIATGGEVKGDTTTLEDRNVLLRLSAREDEE